LEKKIDQDHGDEKDNGLTAGVKMGSENGNRTKGIANLEIGKEQCQLMPSAVEARDKST
jgi:hypothetical protein